LLIKIITHIIPLFKNQFGRISMANVILFRPKFSDYKVQTLPIPWGLLYIASSLIKEGYSVKIIDELINPNWQNMIQNEIKQKPKLFGISCMTGKQIKYSLNFSSFIKKHSDIPVVLGGVHPSILPEQTLRNEYIDFVVKHEGEETIIELMKSFEEKQDLEKIIGLGYKRNNKIFVNKDRPLIKLDNLPCIAYNLIEVDRYIGKRFGSQRSFELCTSRGCPHQCKFCYNLNYNKCTWRSLSVDKIFDNLYEVIDKYKIDCITWREDNFFIDKKRVKEIAERIIREKINIRWHADCRVDYVYNYTQDFIDLLKRSGCHTLTLGVESGSNKILKSINKGITQEQVIKVKEKLTKNKIYQDYHFMMGFPDETDEDIKQTIDLIYKLMRSNKYFGGICGPSLYTPYPGTLLYKKSLTKGFSPPKTLESWINMDWHTLNIPWIKGKPRKVIEDIAWNIMGIGQKFVRNYFKFKFYLLAQYNLHIPCFEKIFVDWLR